MNNTANIEQIHKLARGVKAAALLSLATNLYELYRFFSSPAGFQALVPFALGLVGTLLIWQLGSALQAGKKQALYLWLGLLLIGILRMVTDDVPFSFNLLTIILLGLIGSITGQLTRWTRNGSLA